MSYIEIMPFGASPCIIDCIIMCSSLDVSKPKRWVPLRFGTRLVVHASDKVYALMCYIIFV